MSTSKLLIICLLCLGIFSCSRKSGNKNGVDFPSLIPDVPGTTPSYFCTWSAQDFFATGTKYERRHFVMDSTVFGKTGWAKTFYTPIRKDVYFLLDDGWEVPNNDPGDKYFGCGQLDSVKFPNYGTTWAERLKTLVTKIKAEGWKGTGLWISITQSPKGEFYKNAPEKYWSERLKWSKEAGIAYWKVDWGKDIDSIRLLMNALRDNYYPELIIEHIAGSPPINGEKGSGRVSFEISALQAKRIIYSDVLRTYDVTGPLSIPSTLDRVAEILLHGSSNHTKSLINAEDEAYINATLGCAIGIMRYPIGDAEAGVAPNIFFGGGNRFSNTRPIRKMLDEVLRGVRWQRVAPAFTVNANENRTSPEILFDNWKFQNGEIWAEDLYGKNIRQGAPAIITRGLELPVVTVTKGPKPFVIAARNPNGAISIAALGRTDSTGYHALPAEVILKVGENTGLIGVFGEFHSLTLT